MSHVPSRRQFIHAAAAAVPAALALGPRNAAAAEPVPAMFPTQSAELVQEMVVVAHGNVPRVRDLVSRQNTLAKAAWDWGFGDWETALGAASHVGNREIAELLLAHGAHPTMFSAAMLGQLDVVKAFIAAAPGVERTRGPHSISLLKHAVAGGSNAKSVVEYLKTLDGADDRLATAPLSEADIARLSGAYVFGITPADRFDVAGAGGQLQISRPGRYPRGLLHRGSFEFSPVGAESVRLVFSESADDALLTIHDPDVVLTAHRKAKP